MSTAIQFFQPLDPMTRYVGQSLGVGGPKYYGIALASNGMLYCTPHTAERVLKINPYTGETSLIGSTYTGNTKWIGITAHINGKLYCAPYANTTYGYLEIDPQTDTTRTIPIGGSRYGTGIAYHPNGKLYSFRRNNQGNVATEFNQLFEFDPNAETVTLVGNDDLSVSQGALLHGSILGRDNKIYAFPRSKRSIFRFDTVTGVTEQVGNNDMLGNNSLWGGAAIVAENNKIYAAGYVDISYTYHLDEITLDYGAATGYVAGRGGGNHSGIAQAPNGKLFSSPFNNYRVTQHTISSNTDRPFGMNLGEIDGKYSGIAVAGNGKLYCSPYNADRVLEIYGQGEFNNFNEVYGFNSNNEPTYYMRN